MVDTSAFVDIIEPRRKNNDMFSFMSRKWNPHKAHVVTNAWTPDLLKEYVAKSQYLQKEIELESQRTGQMKEDVLKKLVAMLDEIGLDQKLYVVRWLGIFLISGLLKTRTSVLVHEQSLMRVCSNMGSNPVIFLPTHRSYADFILMTYICYHYDIELPAVAAGMDFYNMAVMGQALRNTRAFYTRRTFAGDKLYAAAFKRYVHALVTKYPAPIEFFLEGTRSRSNKSVSPKYGLLSMVVLPLLTREVNDITIVPISINYDRLMEQTPFAYEHLGVPKPKESASSFLQALEVLNDSFGNIYVNIGEGFSARKYFESSVRSVNRALEPIELQKVTPEDYVSVSHLAADVIQKHQDLAVIAAYNLVAVVLMDSLINGHPLSRKEFDEKIGNLVQIMKDLKASLFAYEPELINDGIKKVLAVQKNNVKFDLTGRLKLICSYSMPVMEHTKRKMKGHILMDKTMNYAVPVIRLQLYVNPVLCFIVPYALIYIIAARRPILDGSLREIYMRMRDLLQYEFVFKKSSEENVFNNSFQYCLHNNIVTRDGDFIKGGSNSKHQDTIKSLLWPFLCCLQKSALVLSQVSATEEASALKKIQEKIERDLHNGNNCHPYALSLECITNCIRGMNDTGVLLKENGKTPSAYCIVPDKMKDLLQMLDDISVQYSVKFDNSNGVLLDAQNVPCRL